VYEIAKRRAERLIQLEHLVKLAALVTGVTEREADEFGSHPRS
jgi:hypothetical protein